MVFKFNLMKKKIPLSIQVIRFLFPIVEKVSLSLAGKWFVKLFFTPINTPLSESENKFLDSSQSYQINLNDKLVNIYEWGEGTPVLFVHGWMGRVTQFDKMVYEFVKTGHKVVSFDAPAHGRSSGRQTHLLEFSEIILKLITINNGFRMIVGHSLGGVAALLAIKENKLIDQLVMISSPSVAEYILSEFRKGVNASEKTTPYLLRHVKKEIGIDFEDLAASQQVKNLKNVGLLLIHDQQDKQVSFKNSLETKANYPLAKLILTEGLGHNRILKDQKVINQVLHQIVPLEIVD